MKPCFLQSKILTFTRPPVRGQADKKDRLKVVTARREGQAKSGEVQI